MRHLVKKKNKGLSMIELIVAVAIFIVAITIVTSLFMSTLKGLRKNIALQNVQDNARFMIDFVTKELRMSKLNGSFTDGAYYSLPITRSDDTNVTYSFSANNLVRAGTSTGQVNSAGIVVTGRFYISGASADSNQPKVTIILKVEDPGTNPEDRAVINVQATLSLRNPILDL